MPNPLIPPLGPGPAPNPAAPAASAADDADSDNAQSTKQAAANQSATKADAFDGSARQSIAATTATLNNALAGALTQADASNLLGSFASDALIGEILMQSGAAGMLTDAAALANLTVPELNQLFEGLLGQFAQLAQDLGQPLNADTMTMLATLNGQPASLLDAHTEATTLWRGMALSNPPLSILTLAATGHEVDAQSGLLPRQAYRVLGTFVDGHNERQVRLVPGGPGGAPTDEESMLAQALTVPFTALQRAMLLALIGDPRIDMPYAQELDDTKGPGQANCCMFAHGTGAARGPRSVQERPASLSEPRCRSCAYARQLCLPEE